MTIYVSPHLECLGALREAGIDARTEGAPARALRIGILNLMPKKQLSEAEFLHLLGCAGRDLEVVFLRTESYTPRNTSAAYLAANYLGWSSVRERGLDGLIITGAYLGVRFNTFEEAAFWPEVAEILAWADESVRQVLGVCWGAQAMMYRKYGIPTRQLPIRLFGVYPQELLVETHPLCDGLPKHFSLPVTRKTTTAEEDIVRERGLIHLARSSETGPCLVVDREGPGTYVLNHAELASDYLQRDYLWRIETDPTAPFPVNYFATEDPRGAVIHSWAEVGRTLYGNWLQQI